MSMPVMSILVIYIAAAQLYCPVVMADTPDPVEELYLNANNMNGKNKPPTNKNAKDAIFGFTTDICSGYHKPSKKVKPMELKEVDLSCIESEQLFGMEYQKLFEKHYCRDEPLFSKLEIAWDICLQHHYPWIDPASQQICAIKSSFGEFVACYCNTNQVAEAWLYEDGEENLYPSNISRSFCISKPECYFANSGIYQFEESSDDVISGNCTAHLSYVLDGGYNSHSWYILAQAKDRLRPKSPYSQHSPCRGQNFTSPFDVGQLILDDLNNEIIIWKPEGFHSYQNFSDGSERQVDIFRAIYTKILKEKVFLNLIVFLGLGLVVGYILTLFSRESIKESWWLTSILQLARTATVYLEIYEMFRYLAFWTYISFFSFLTSWKFWLAFCVCHFYISRYKCVECKDNFVLHFWRSSLFNLILDLPALTLIQTMSVVTTIRLIHLLLAAILMVAVLVAALSNHIHCDDHKQINSTSKFLDDKSFKIENRKSNSENRFIDGKKHVKHKELKKFNNSKTPKENTKPKFSNRAVFISAKDCPNLLSTPTKSQSTKRTPETYNAMKIKPKNVHKSPDATPDNKPKTPKSDIQTKDAKKERKASFGSITMKPLCDLNIKSLMESEKIRALPQMPQLYFVNKANQSITGETIRFKPGASNKTLARPINQAKVYEESPNLNHWLTSNAPIGVPSNQKSKFLPFITRNLSSNNYTPGSSGGNSPVSSKDENDDDIIDFKLDEHDAEMFCLEDNLESSYAEGSYSKSSMSPVSSTSSGSCYGKLINKNVIVSKNLPLAQILSKDLPLYDVESIAMALDNILDANMANNLTLNQFRDLVVEELSRDNLEDRDNGEEREIEEDIFISDSEEEALIEEECAICTETLNMEDNTKRLDACGHKFHADCIKPWLHKQNSCPTCRRSVCEP